MKKSGFAKATKAGNVITDLVIPLQKLLPSEEGSAFPSSGDLADLKDLEAKVQKKSLVCDADFVLPRSKIAQEYEASFVDENQTLLNAVR